VQDEIMKKIALLSLIALALFGCDQPIKSRYLNGTPGINPNGQGFGGDDNGATTGIGNGGGFTTSGSIPNPSDNDNDPAVGPGFENCSLNYQYYGASFGFFGACQNSTNERLFKVKFQNSISQAMCFVPVHYNDDGTSYKLGRAECAQSIASGAVYTVPTTKDLPNINVNGLMVIKYSSLNSYMQCMNYKAN